MSTAEILSLASTICYILAGIFLVLAMIFWFVFHIPSVVGDLSGHTARKSIARIRASNEEAGGQGYQPSATNAKRGKLTATMPHPRKQREKSSPSREKAAPGMPETGLLETNKAETPTTAQTDLLEESDATALLVDENATTPLHEEPVQRVRRTGGKKLDMLDEVILIHTDEVI